MEVSQVHYKYYSNLNKTPMWPTRQRSKCRHCQKQLPFHLLNSHTKQCPQNPFARFRTNQHRSASNPRASEKQESSNSKNSRRKKEQYQCYLCGDKKTLAQLDDHIKNRCINKEVQCEDCHEKFPRNLMDEHRLVCEGVDSDEEQPEQESSRQEQSSENYNSQSDNDSSSQVVEVSSSSLSIAARQRIIIRLLNSMCQSHEQGDISDHYREILQQMDAVYRAIQRRRREENQDDKDGMSKSQINQIPSKNYKFDGINYEVCSICYVEIKNNEKIKDLECKHLFHVDCIAQWLLRNRTCPNCKRQIKLKKIPRNSGKKEVEVKPTLQALLAQDRWRSRRR